MTQGLITICVSGVVAMKIVAVSDGMKAQFLADKIKALGAVPSLSDAYRLAKEVGFGSEADLVVIGEGAVLHRSEGRLSHLYLKTFKRPRFNPRWKRGTADFTVVINF